MPVTNLRDPARTPWVSPPVSATPRTSAPGATPVPEAPLPARTGALPRPAEAPAQRASFGSWLGQLAGSSKLQVMGVVAGTALMLAVGLATSGGQVAPEVELATKTRAMVEARFDGDFRQAFDHYAGGDASVDSKELGSFLADSGIGSFATRGFWVSGLLEQFDADKNGAIGWPEFERARDTVNAAVPPTP